MSSVLGVKKLLFGYDSIQTNNIKYALNYLEKNSKPKFILYDDNYCFIYFEDKLDNHYFYWNSKELIRFTTLNQIIRNNFMINSEKIILI